jgi:Tfp pilus assembly protein PilF
MIALMFLAAAASAPAPTAPSAAPTAQALIAGAEHAVRANRLDQASVMISRAIGAGASGVDLDRVMADLAYASGKNAEALARYETVLKRAPANRAVLEPAGIAALKLGNVERASELLSRATALPSASWRAWNALGVVADLRSDWVTADDCYSQAMKLAPDELGPINNQGWSLLLRGRWQDALGYFEKASAINPKAKRAGNNLELARNALAAELPASRAGETDESWAARLNDAGMAAAILGDRGRAIAAFTQALDASGTWYARAANNLETYGSR